VFSEDELKEQKKRLKFDGKKKGKGKEGEREGEKEGEEEEEREKNNEEDQEEKWWIYEYLLSRGKETKTKITPRGGGNKEKERRKWSLKGKEKPSPTLSPGSVPSATSIDSVSYPQTSGDEPLPSLPLSSSSPSPASHSPASSVLSGVGTGSTVNDLSLNPLNPIVAASSVPITVVVPTLTMETAGRNERSFIPTSQIMTLVTTAEKKNDGDEREEREKEREKREKEQKEKEKEEEIEKEKKEKEKEIENMKVATKQGTEEKEGKRDETQKEKMNMKKEKKNRKRKRKKKR